MESIKVKPFDFGSMGWRLENTYSMLPAMLHAKASPIHVRQPKVAVLNHDLAQDLGLDFGKIGDEASAHLFSGQQLPEGSKPLAQAYAGHQFGGFTMLGDGRAILMGEHRSPSGALWDIQFKGSGPTRFSRRGDGRAALGPMLREYIISEAMHALGIPTTRSLAVVTTGEPVFRETALRGAILTRVAASHIRVGTFEYAARVEDQNVLNALVEYSISRHEPDLEKESDRYLQFLARVINRQADLVARWQLVGFVHGVMNTDNMTISGETIDYGPCAFMDVYNPDTVFSSIDHAGRYAFGNQPRIAQWNLARLAESMLPLLDPEEEKSIGLATELLRKFPELHEQYWLNGMRKKLGMTTAEDADLDLVQWLLNWMELAQLDYTQTFRNLSMNVLLKEGPFTDPKFLDWHGRWCERLLRENRSQEDVFAGMKKVNPAVIARNYHVEQALRAATDHEDYSVMDALLKCLSKPFEEQPGYEKFHSSPPFPGYRTFCGT